MIIGNNNKNNFNNNQPNFTSNFSERFTNIVNEANKDKNKILQENTQINHYSNTTSKSEMADKSFAMLEERYKKGLISLAEFNKKCNQINKMREK